MKKTLTVTGLILAVALMTPALAGDGECGHETQVCLDYMAKMGNKGYAGIDLDSNEDHSKMTVTEVVDGAPAGRAGIKVGDVLLAIDGISVTEEGAMHKIQEKMTPGNTVSFTVSRNGKEKMGNLTLIEMPGDVHAQVVGEHMLQHTSIELASN